MSVLFMRTRVSGKVSDWKAIEWEGQPLKAVWCKFCLLRIREVHNWCNAKDGMYAEWRDWLQIRVNEEWDNDISDHNKGGAWSLDLQGGASQHCRCW